MEKETSVRGNGNQNCPLSLDETDKQILQILQDDFPIVEEPWLEISNRLKINQEEVLKRVKRLTEAGAITKIGPIFDSSRIGLKAATLVAMRVPQTQVPKVAATINQYDNVSHNYERDHDYNVWFTLAAADSAELTKTLEDIKQKTGVEENDILNLPTANRFKINVHFQLT
jgi:DNA-binding Lrp family transcriptional regulator